MAQGRVLLFFDISTYLTEKYFDVVWDATPRGPPQMDPPKINFFKRLKIEFYFVLMSADI